jgi:GT2 family glycosyltransferase
MFQPVKILDFELSCPATDIEGLDGYGALKALVRLHNQPVGFVNLPLYDGRCSSTALQNAILDQHQEKIIQILLRNGLPASLQNSNLRITNLFNNRFSGYGEHVLYETDGDCTIPHSALGIPHSPLPTPHSNLPSVTVAGCTRDRAAELPLCLEALAALAYQNLEIIVVDNAPGDDTTERLVKTRYTAMRYVCEPRPGLNWARNRAILEAHGEIIAFTDDDVVVDTKWLEALARVFAESPEVMAVTGLVVPYELETEAQILFERFNGFSKGFDRKRYRIDPDSGRKEKFHIRAGRFGTGANMAFRRSLFDKIGLFDPALDVGTVTNGGGDLEMFFRVIQEGYTLIYEPEALVWHRHRRDYAGLRKQLRGWGTGCYAYLVRSALAYPNMRYDIIRFGLKWLWKGNFRRLLRNLLRPSGVPNALIWDQMRGSFIGLFRYPRAKRIAEKIARDHGAMKKTFSGRAVRKVLLNKNLNPVDASRLLSIDGEHGQ